MCVRRNMKALKKSCVSFPCLKEHTIAKHSYQYLICNVLKWPPVFPPQLIPLEPTPCTPPTKAMRSCSTCPPCCRTCPTTHSRWELVIDADEYVDLKKKKKNPPLAVTDCVEKPSLCVSFPHSAPRAFMAFVLCVQAFSVLLNLLLLLSSHSFSGSELGAAQ